MVWFACTELERPPLSVILPRLYLGAESDVTQERLASLDISYVLSVSRCSPQPAFLPFSRYLRIPIDDSLSDDMLPWIPQALRFIDSARSSGASVLVHCAAGISRSPALTVAYVMYRLDLDLDHAYRFVKDRRPSISPNLNFLGQLQHFQGTLQQKVSPSVTLEQQMDPRLDSTFSDIPMIHQHTDQAPPGPASLSSRDNSVLSSSGNTNYRLPHTLHLNLNGNGQGSPGSMFLQEKRKSLTLSLTPLSQGPPLNNSSRSPPASNVASVRAEAEQLSRHMDRTRTDHSQCPKAEAKEALLSPLSFTLNKLLSWGERLLLVAPVRMGQPALPYSC